MNAMEILAKMEAVHAERKGARMRFELHNPTREVRELIREFDGFVEHNCGPTLVDVWVGEEYCIDPHYNPAMGFGELFECCQLYEEGANPRIIEIQPLFLFPVGNHPIMVAEFQYGYADRGERRTEHRESRFNIDLGEEHNLD